MQKKLVTNGSPALAGDKGAAWAIHDAAGLCDVVPRLRYALIEVKLENCLKQIAPSVGRNAPPLHQWPRALSGELEIPSLASLKSNIAALRFELVLCQFAWCERKAGFDPNQPRVPRGQPGGGQWTYAGGGDGGVGGSDAQPFGMVKIVIHPRPIGEGGGDGSGSPSETPPLGDWPHIPEEEPASRQLLNAFIKQAAYWLAKAALREVISPEVGTFINILEGVHWAYKAAPYIQAYLDSPKSLDELQRTVSNPAKGYDIHHIVEKTPAEKDGYPRRMIDAAENLARIPTLKHWEINGWYGRPNKDFGGLSPREYLRGKNWAERVRVGQMALIKYGVLKQ